MRALLYDTREEAIEAEHSIAVALGIEKYHGEPLHNPIRQKYGLKIVESHADVIKDVVGSIKFAQAEFLTRTDRDWFPVIERDNDISV